MINSFKKINDFGVYKNYEWQNSVKQFDINGNNPTDYLFEKNNIIYGRNYAGKTTLSRIIESLKTGQIDAHYENPDFEIELDNNSKITQNNLSSHTYDIRVFNQDYIKKNLAFLQNENEVIKSFLVLGEQNNQIETQIQALNNQLGSRATDENEATGLFKDLEIAIAEYESSDTALQTKQKNKTTLLSKKATRDDSSIKNNSKYFGQNYINYNKTQLERDINASTEADELLPETIVKLKTLIDEEVKTNVSTIPEITSNAQDLLNNANELLVKQVTLSNPIQDLVENSILEQWVKTGKELHKEETTTCKFCGNIIDERLWAKINAHFSKESEQLENDLQSLLDSIQNEIRIVDSKILFSFNEGLVYREYRENINEIVSGINNELKLLKEDLEHISNNISDKVNNLHNVFAPLSKEFPSIKNVNNKIAELNSIINFSNKRTSNIDSEKEKAQKALFDGEIARFKKESNYTSLIAEIANAESHRQEKLNEKNDLENQIQELRLQITQLESERTNEKKGADEINKILDSNLGHKYLKLEAVTEYGSVYYQIKRNDKTAHNLSEGEKSLIAFCYFVANLEDINANKSNRIIWIDDPVSSLDSDHIFFIYSLIREKVTSNIQNYKQLFISTHNLEFLKFTKRLVKSKKNNKVNFYLIDKNENGSQIKRMPNYLVLYTSEFNYLFETIYRCASEQQEDDNFHLFYNFGNHCRKFLEIYLSFHFPDSKESNEEIFQKMKLLFGNEVPNYLIDRVNNEYSHLAGSFERGMTQIESAEISKSAKAMLKMIKNKDSNQFQSLVNSISINQDLHLNSIG